MRCDGCGNDTAIIQVQEVVDGKQSSIRLCATCAARQRFRLSSVTGGAMEKLMESVAELAAQLGSEDGRPTKQCPGCGQDSQSVRKSGLAGCPDCYEAFADLFAEMHPEFDFEDDEQAPAIPVNPQPPTLDEQLAIAVAEERYEDAARLRDRIRAASSGVAE